ncbi:MAG TPA: hypothetical protein PLF40_33045, partial [Kofleriaceae bacterium]|nr:hypothetical protein [Kofleriaceae bacterium]
VVLTADRPAELHYCGAPQTIDQHGLFGRFARAALQLGTPDAAPLSLRGCRLTVAHAVGLAMGPIPGPVQLNIPLRKPLEPAAPHTEEERDFVSFSDNIADATPIVSHATVQATVPAHVTELIATAQRGIIAVGNVPAYDRDLAAAVAELARATGFVVIAESGSQLRLAGRCISHHDALVSCAARGVLAPDLIVQIGGELASSGWIAARVAWASATTVMLDRFAQHDPHSQAAAIIVGELATTVRALTVPSTAASLQPRAAYAATWNALDAVASASVETALAANSTAEPGFVKAAVRSLPKGAGLLLGNSLPIRVVDQVCDPSDDNERWVVTQRGANGIDGLLAGAAGAVAARGPAMLLIGDVSFSHDVGSLAVLRTCN